MGSEQAYGSVTALAAPWEAPGPETTPDRDGQPGALRGVVTLTLETRQAHRMVRGRPGSAGKPAIIGLLGFASLLRALWHGARADDPYADWWLLRIHQALSEADQALQRLVAETESLLAGTGAFRALPGASVRPARTALRFSNPYAYRGALLLGVYDRLARAVLTAQYLGVLTRGEAERRLGLGGRALRRAFLSPMGYRVTGVTREDLHQGTARSLHAREAMGAVPEAIVTGTVRAPHAPSRPAPVSVLAGEVTLAPPGRGA